MPRGLGWIVRVSIALLLAVGWTALSAGAAQAHASLVSSSPAAGQSMAEAPAELVLTFDLAVDVSDTAVRVVASSGETYRLASAQAAPDPEATAATELHIPLPDLAEDQYLVRWSTVSVDDYHVVAGTFPFGVGVVVEPGGATSGEGAAPVAVLADGLLRFGGLAGLAGALGGALLLLRFGGRSGDQWPEGVPGRLARWARRSALLGSLSVGLLGLVLLASAGALPSTRVFSAWAAAAVGLLVGGVLLGHRPTAAGGPSVSPGTWVPLVAAAWGLGALGHGALRPAGGIPGALVSTAHVTATCAWLGGTVLLTALVVPAMRAGSSPWVGPALRAFAAVAAPAVGLSVVTGFLLASATVPSVDALTQSTYGRLLVVKLLLVIVAAAAGGLTYWRLRQRRTEKPRPASRSTRRRLVAESWLIGGAVLVAAALATSASPTGLRWLPGPDRPSSQLLSQAIDDLFVTVRLSPGTPGSNFVILGVAETRKPSPAPITAVHASISGGSPITATPQAAGTLTSRERYGTAVGDDVWLVPSATLAGDGPQQVVVTVERVGRPPTKVTFEWKVASPGTGSGGASLRNPWLGLAVLSGLVVAAVGVVQFLRLRRRGRLPDHGDADGASEIDGPKGDDPVSQGSVPVH